MEQIGESVKAVIHLDGKILLQLRDEKPNIYYPGVWGLFGGNVESNEKQTSREPAPGDVTVF